MKTTLFLMIFSAIAGFNQLFAWNIPVHVSPVNGYNTKGGVTIDWNAVSGSLAYQYEIDTVLSFNSPVKIQGTQNYINSGSGNSDTQFSFGNNFYYGKTYYWRVRAYIVGDTSAWSSPWSFNTPAYGPTLLSPANGSSNIKVGVTLDWDSHYYVTAYDWQADTVPSFNSPVLRQGTNTYVNTSSGNSDTQTTLGDLYYGVTYYWRVRSRNAVDTSFWTTAWTFTTTQNGPTLVSPANGSANIKVGVTLDWDSHYYVTAYDWQADTVPSFNSPVLRQGTNTYVNTSSGNSDTQTTLGDLYYGVTYYWRVRSRNAVDTSLWTTAWTFTTTQNGPALVSPANGSSNIKVGVTLDWDSHYYVTAYDWQADTVPSFNSPVLRQGTNTYVNTSSGNSDTQTTLGDLYYGVTYYWRVRSRNAVDTSLWTTAWTFTTTQNGPTLVSPANSSSNIKVGVTLDWDSHYYVTAYDWQADTVPSFNSPALRQGTNTYVNTSSGNSDTQTTLGDLYYGVTYYWRVRSRNAVDTSLWTTAWTFTTTQNGPALVSPANGQLNVNTAGTTLNWDSHYYVVKYQLQVDTNNLFNTPYLISVDNMYINTSSGNSDTQHGLTSLPANTVFYWRVRSVNNVDTSDWTSTWAFSTGSSPIVTPTPPFLLAPSNNSVISVTTVTIDWDAVTGVSYYDFEIDTVPTFTSSWLIAGTNNYISSSGTNMDTEHGLTNLAFDKTYYWRVRTRTSSATSAWSSAWNFTVNNTASVTEEEVKNNILVYPNPFSTWTTLQTDDHFYNVTLTMENCLGQTVKEIKNINGQRVTISRDDLPDGLYLVRLIQDNKVISINKLMITGN